MEQPERSLTSLGRHIAELQDQAPEATLDRDRGRARLLRENTPSHNIVSARPRLVAAALFAAAMALFVGLWLTQSGDPLRFVVGQGRMGAAGEWIAAPSEDALPIHFSDGSELTLAPGGRARVAQVSADGAEIALERGSLDLQVVHREKTKWLVRVGPFQVHVTGTRFEASWDPVAERCSVALHEGAITVSGPVVGQERAVRAGERIVVSPATGTLETSQLTEAPSPTTARETGPGHEPKAARAEAEGPGGASTAAPKEDGSRGPAASPEQAPSGGDREDPARSSAAPQRSHVAKASEPNTNSAANGGAAAQSWRELARAGKHKEALSAAERESFDAICAGATASDLYALGEAARLGGSAARASQAFLALRTRFPGSVEAASAAFLLGRSAQDRNKDHAAAATFFARYLSEQPKGVFAAEAAGRLVEARDRSGDKAGAKSAAERYLAAYPNGAHAAYASRVLARAREESPSPAESAGAPSATNSGAPSSNADAGAP